MRVQDITGKDLIEPNLRAMLRTDALRELVEIVVRRRGCSALQKEAYLAEILRRHERQPSGLGRGLAFPNARIADLAEPTLAIGLSQRGLDFQAMDGVPSHGILLYLGRADPPEEERQMLSRLSLALTHPKTAQALTTALTVDQVWETVLAIDARQNVGAH